MSVDCFGRRSALGPSTSSQRSRRPPPKQRRAKLIPLAASKTSTDFTFRTTDNNDDADRRAGRRHRRRKLDRLVGSNSLQFRHKPRLVVPLRPARAQWNRKHGRLLQVAGSIKSAHVGCSARNLHPTGWARVVTLSASCPDLEFGS